VNEDIEPHGLGGDLPGVHLEPTPPLTQYRGLRKGRRELVAGGRRTSRALAGMPLVAGLKTVPCLLASQVVAGVASAAAWCRHSLSRLWVPHKSFHSAVQAPSPRRMNRRAPRTSLTWPKTGSTVCPRLA
jgi:hypothetical protein